MAALWEHKLQRIPLGLRDIVMVLWSWETLNRDGNMTKLLETNKGLGAAPTVPCPKLQLPFLSPTQGNAVRRPAGRRPAGKTGPTL